MNDIQFRALLVMLICWEPVDCESEHKALAEYANWHCKRMGYADWVDAYHHWTPGE